MWTWSNTWDSSFSFTDSIYNLTQICNVEKLHIMWWGLYNGARMSNPNLDKFNVSTELWSHFTSLMVVLSFHGSQLFSLHIERIRWWWSLSECGCSSLLSHYALLCCYPLHLQLPDMTFRWFWGGSLSQDHLLAISCKAAWMLPKSFSPCLTVSARASPACSLSASRDARPAA